MTFAFGHFCLDGFLKKYENRFKEKIQIPPFSES